MLDKLFKFPIVMVDAENEEQKKTFNTSYDKPEMDLIIGEAEVPYYEFICIADRWLPGEESLSKALNGRFDACHVNFGMAGTYIVPWSKEKFKEKLVEFITQFNKKVEDAEQMLLQTLKSTNNEQQQQEGPTGTEADDER